MAFQLGGGLQLGGGGMGDLLGWGGAAAGVGGGILGAIGAEQAASGTAAADLARAQGYAFDAASQGTTAGNIWSATARENTQANYEANRVLGAQRAAYGAAGVNPNSGTPLDLLADTEAEIKREAMNRFYTGEARATAAGQQYTADQMAAQAARQAASEARSAGTTGAFSAILGGVGSALGSFGKFL